MFKPKINSQKFLIIKAAMMGCGSWAENGIAVTTTGVGEYLIKTMFAKECATHLLNSGGNYIMSLNDVFHNKFLG